MLRSLLDMSAAYLQSSCLEACGFIFLVFGHLGMSVIQVFFFLCHFEPSKDPILKTIPAVFRQKMTNQNRQNSDIYHSFIQRIALKKRRHKPKIPRNTINNKINCQKTCKLGCSGMYGCRLKQLFPSKCPGVCCLKDVHDFNVKVEVS